MAFFIILLLLSACGLLPTGSEEAYPALATPTATLEATPEPQPQIEFAIPITTTESIQTLTIWLPPEIAARTESGTVMLEEQLIAIQANYPDLILRVEPKAATGKGGILDYLRTGRNVAPTILPDLVALPVEQLPAAADDSLIYPLDTVLDPALIEDLYPSAQAFAGPKEQIIGYPFVLTNLPHIAFNTTIITGTLPSTWSELITDETNKLVIAADGRPGATLALQFYLDAGGTVTNEAGQPNLDIEPLTFALAQLHEASVNGFIIPQSSSLKTYVDSWQLYQSGAASLTTLTSGQYLSSRSEEINPGISAHPGIDGHLTPLVDGWAWAISTPDPVKQALAAEFLAALVAEENLSQWSYQSQLLPARKSALALWPSEDVYTRLAQQEIERARPLPVSANSNLMTAISNAVFDVVSQTKSPSEAAAEAVNALQP